MRLSHEKINSYVGDVFPLKVISDNDISNESVKWTVAGDAVSIRSFDNDPELPFSDAVMLSLKKVGSATVTAEIGGKTCSLSVDVRERKEYLTESAINFYRGDMHTHTTRLHDHEAFINRTEGFQEDMIGFIKEENLLDFGVITDHSVVMGYGYEFMRAFLTEEKMRPMGPILFPGSESGVTLIGKNRFGLDTNNGGELVVINADNHVNAFCWNDFLEAFKTSVDPILIFAHPQLDSIKYGNWNFQFEKISDIPQLLKMAKGMEMGNGIAIKANLLHEYSFSRALDAGFKISTTCGSDGHGIRGYKICPGKTVIMAYEKTKEAFVDALINLRFYACESGNVKIKYSVNGMTAPCELPLANKYSFNVELDYFEDDESTKIVKCQVVSDKGEWIKEINGIDSNSISFDIESDTARYFYIRFQDSLGRRTWSPPVWCSRQFDKFIEPNVNPIDKTGFEAYDEASQSDASQVLFGNHVIPYESAVKEACIVIDMQKERKVSAVGYTTPRMPRTSPSAHGECVVNHARYPRRIRISLSKNGTSYETVYIGGIRTYSNEEIFEFIERTARFVKFEVLSTVGDEYGREEYLLPHCLIGIISIFEKK